MSTQIRAKKRVQYKPEAMALAIQMVRSGQMSRKGAAKAYGIPKTTLLDKLSGRVPEATSLGRKTVLTPAEENVLVAYANLMCDIGYPLTKKEFMFEVQHILNLDGRETPFRDNLPGKDWFLGFQRRHPEMAFRKPMSLGHERAAVTMDKVNNWYTGVHTYLQKEFPDTYDALLKDPRRLYNADESGFPLSVKPGKVLAPSGAKHVYNVVTSTKIQITVMAGFNGFGEYLPPMILFPGERIRDVGLAGFPEAIYTTTPNGWMTSDTFVEFLKILDQSVSEKNIARPVLLFVDGHSTHMTLEAAQFCKDHQIILYCLLPNATHLLQAADVGLFSPLKSAWQAAVKTWQMSNIGQAVTKKDFPSIFKHAWSKVATFQNAANGFRRSGLFPFSPEGIDKTKLGPAKLASKTQFETQTETRNTVPNSEASSTEVVNSSHALEVSVNETGSVPSLIALSTADIDLSAASCNTVQELSESTSSVVFTASHSSTILQSNTQESPEVKTSDVRPSVVCSQNPLLLSNPQPSTSKSLSQDPSTVSSAFQYLRVPEVKPKKKIVQLRHKLPKALSGDEALKMLKEREDRKKELAMLKEERKRERELKRKQKEEEKERRKREKQCKLKNKIPSKPNKQKSKSKKMTYSSESDTDMSDRDIPYMDHDSDDFEESFVDVCPVCKTSRPSEKNPDAWISCESCCRQWHVVCAGYSDFEVNESTFVFVCNACE